MGNVIELQIKVPSQTCFLSLVGRIGEKLVTDACNLPENKMKVAHDINAILTESMANAIKHANPDMQNTFVKILIKVSDKLISVKVYDTGKGFDLDSVLKPINGSQYLNDTGRGLFIISSLMDSVNYRKIGAENVLEMSRKL